MIHFLLQLAGRWPERFCFWLDRTATGGPDVIQALKIAESMTKDAAPFARETLLDFGAEMGWRFLDEESMPLWRAVGRLGNSFSEGSAASPCRSSPCISWRECWVRSRRAPNSMR